MRTRHNDSYENDPTPSRAIIERYRAVVYGLSGHEDPDAIAALIGLTTVEDHDVGNWAVFGIGSQIDADTPEIRDALFAALSDADTGIREEGLVGLAKRKDPRAKAAILDETYELTSGLAAGKDARATVVLASCPDPDVLIQFPENQPYPGTAQDV